MKKKQDNSVRASVLHIALALTLISILAVVVASSFAQRSDFSAPAQGQSSHSPQTINTYTGVPVGVLPVTVTATGGVMSPTSYPTLREAFDAINTGTHQGDIIIDIVSSTTEGSTPATLNGSGASAASYTSVLIRPVNDGVSISGNPAGGFGVVQLNGASNVTIDGDNPNTPGTNQDLTIQNTTTNTSIFSSVIRIALATSGSNHAGDNMIKNLNLVGNASGRIEDSVIGNPIAGDADQVYSIGITVHGSGTIGPLSEVIRGNIIYVEGWVPTNSFGANNAISVGGTNASRTGTYPIENNTVGRLQNITRRPRPTPAPRPSPRPHTSPAGIVNGTSW
jgi:hypothetical protein